MIRTLLGGSGMDSLKGGAGDDRLVGYSDGLESDTLTGGRDKDTFVLGDESDVFYRGGGDSFALITDFNRRLDNIEVNGDAISPVALRREGALRSFLVKTRLVLLACFKSG